MRIVHLVTRSQRRGAERVAVELARELEASGDDNRVRALGLAFDGRADPEVPALTPRTDEGAHTVLAAALALRHELGRVPADVVLAHGGRAVEAAVLARRRRRPLVVWQRILAFPPGIWRPLPRLRWRAVAHRVDAAVALTPELGGELRRLGFRGPIWTIPNFRDVRRFEHLDRAAARRALHDELGLAPDVALVGLVGHLIAQKRPDRALEAFAAVHRVDARAHLVVAGDGPLRRDLEAGVVARGLTSAVHVLGPRDDVERVLGGIDVLMLTSDAEGHPGVLIEAQMAGCPAVTVPAGSVGDIVAEGTGIVTEHVDAAEVAAAVVELLHDPARRAALGDAARRHSSRFSAPEAARTYRTHLARLVAGPRPDRRPDHPPGPPV